MMSINSLRFELKSRTKFVLELNDKCMVGSA